MKQVAGTRHERVGALNLAQGLDLRSHVPADQHGDESNLIVLNGDDVHSVVIDHQ